MIEVGVFVTTLLAATFRSSVPLLFGTIGEAFAERSGVLNLGIEGMMLMGASVGFITVYFIGNLWLGVLVAATVAMLMGLLMAFLSVTIGAQQHVAGLAITFAGMGMSLYLYRILVSVGGGVPPTITGFSPISIPLLNQIPVIGTFFEQYALFYLGLILVPIVAFIFYKTTFGLKISAVGQNPRAADTAGVNVFKIRYICLIIAGALAGIAGAWFSLAEANQFLPLMTGGRGWVCIALVIFGTWDPFKILGGALIFGGIDGLSMTVKTMGIAFPTRVLDMLPYIFTIVILIIAVRRATYPAALLKPYRREE